MRQLFDHFLYPVIAFISLFNNLMLINANLDVDHSLISGGIVSGLYTFIETKKLNFMKDLTTLTEDC